MGTATAFLGLALARMGHSVEILFAWQPHRPIDPYWAQVYADAGVRIRPVPDSGERVEPGHFAVRRNVELALRADPPDVVITHDLSAPAYSALRLRQLGIGLEDVLFVVFCHGTRRWIMEMSAKVAARDTRELLAESVLEQASLELADLVVSPSAYLVDWMREASWQLPERTLVIPYFTRSGATGEPSPVPASTDSTRVRRLAFFGRLEDKKGIRPFLAGLNRLDPDLLRGVELEFIGKTTTTWTPGHIETLLSRETRNALLRVSFETELDQPEALARLATPGTLAVMPSLGDNSPNTVYECLEHGIPFIASAIGGIPELVAPDDRQRVLFPPTAEGVAAALRRVLSAGEGLRAARPAFDAGESFAAWARVIETPPARSPSPSSTPSVDVIVVRRTGQATASRVRAALDRQTYVDFTVIECHEPSVEQARTSGLEKGTAPYVVFLDEDDSPDDELLTLLVRAQTASNADVITCALRLRDEHAGQTLRFFSGEPHGLGALSNEYGTVALFGRAMLQGLNTPWRTEKDPDWPLLTALAMSGAQIVSVPVPLVTRSVLPGTVEESPRDALLVLQRLEQAAPEELRLVGRLAAGLAALPSSQSRNGDPSVPHRQGVAGLARPVLRRVWRAMRA
jgi:O-antigen biosynthesis protein